MKLYHHLTLLCVATLSISDAATVAKVNIDDSKKIIGVSSVAGLTSRNGRVSSIGGVRFFHVPDNHYTGSVSSQGSYYQPIAVAEAGDGHAAAASINYYPKSLVVSSSAGSGNIRHVSPWFPKIPTINNMFQSPDEIFEHARNLHKWLPRDLFKFISPNTQYKEAWSYPNYNPFDNFWR